MYKDASEVTKKAANTNIKFWGVLASTAIIPAVCNLIQPPIMAAYAKNQEQKKAMMAKNNNIPTVGPVNKPHSQGIILCNEKSTKI